MQISEFRKLSRFEISRTHQKLFYVDDKCKFSKMKIFSEKRVCDVCANLEEDNILKNN